jgi:hypothetical protein
MKLLPVEMGMARWTIQGSMNDVAGIFHFWIFYAAEK